MLKNTFEGFRILKVSIKKDAVEHKNNRIAPFLAPLPTDSRPVMYADNAVINVANKFETKDNSSKYGESIKQCPPSTAFFSNSSAVHNIQYIIAPDMNALYSLFKNCFIEKDISEGLIQ